MILFDIKCTKYNCNLPKGSRRAPPMASHGLLAKTGVNFWLWRPTFISCKNCRYREDMSGSGIDQALIGKAVKALYKYEAGKSSSGSKKQLIDDYAKPILCQIQLVKEISKPVVRPVRVKIPFSLFSPNSEDHTVCIFCRSEDKKEMNDWLDSNELTTGVTRVLSINDVKKLYKRFSDRKKLLGEHTHFLCDTRVMGQLYNLLGKVFAARNNYPVPIEYSSSTKKVNESILKAVDSTYMHLKGVNITIRFGLNSMSPSDVTSNIVSGLGFAVEKLQNQWNSVQSVHIKTSDSAALPVYSKMSSDTLKYVKQIASGKDVKSSSSSSSSSVSTDKSKAKGKGKDKGKDTPSKSKSSTKEEKKSKGKGEGKEKEVVKEVVKAKAKGKGEEKEKEKEQEKKVEKKEKKVVAKVVEEKEEKKASKTPLKAKEEEKTKAKTKASPAMTRSRKPSSSSTSTSSASATKAVKAAKEPVKAKAKATKKK
jgi:ribosome biogenesis protein UTP30